VMNDILTVDEVAALLKISRRSAYELTRERTRRRQKKPIPLLRLNAKCVRFKKADVEQWIEELSREAA
jgi:excisionase family DNA binding protein